MNITIDKIIFFFVIFSFQAPLNLFDRLLWQFLFICCACTYNFSYWFHTRCLEKNSFILWIAPLLCPNIHEKGKGVLQVRSKYFLPCRCGLGKVFVSSIAAPNNRSNKFFDRGRYIRPVNRSSKNYYFWHLRIRCTISCISSFWIQVCVFIHALQPLQ